MFQTFAISEKLCYQILFCVFNACVFLYMYHMKGLKQKRMKIDLLDMNSP